MSASVPLPPAGETKTKNSCVSLQGCNSTLGDLCEAGESHPWLHLQEQHLLLRKMSFSSLYVPFPRSFCSTGEWLLKSDWLCRVFWDLNQQYWVKLRTRKGTASVKGLDLLFFLSQYQMSTCTQPPLGQEFAAPWMAKALVLNQILKKHFVWASQFWSIFCISLW